MKRIVAVEVTFDFVRGIEIENPFTTKPKLVKYGEIALPQGAAGESEVFEIDIVKEAFEELWKVNKFSTKEVALGIGGRKTIVREYETPLAEIEKIRSNLKFEAANLLPAQMGNAMLDFYPTELKNSDTGIEVVQGLFVASPAEPAEKLIASLTSAGLDVQIVDYLPFGIARVARKAFGKEGEYLLVNIKSYSTDIVALRNGSPQMVRVIPNGLIVREHKAGKHRGSADSAASFSGTETSPNDPVESVIAGIRNTLNFYENKGGKPAAILLTGEGSLSAELQARLPQVLQMQMGMLSMKDAIEIPKKDEQDPIIQAAALSILGIAMRGLKS